MVSETPKKKSLCNQNSTLATAMEDYGFMFENPKILKLVVLVHSLYLDVGEGSGYETFTGRR